MTLWLHVYCGYPSYAETGAEWRGIDHDAHMLVQTLKGRPINGYVQLKGVDGAWRRFTTAQPENAFHLFGDWAAARIRQLGIASGTIVPVPASDCLTIGSDSKGRKLAETIANRLQNFDVVDALHWQQQFLKASEGGPRDAGILHKNLGVISALEPREILLVDDVVTTGGHLLACARALRASGHTVRYAICAAQTVWDHPPDMFSFEPRDLEPGQPGF